jgi:hypothetical protein
MSTFRKVESSNKTIAVIDEIEYFRRRKSTMNRPIPTLASNSICECSNGLGGSGVQIRSSGFTRAYDYFNCRIFKVL